MESNESHNAQSMARWSLSQLGQFIRLLLGAVFLGLFLEIGRRRFRWRAFFVSLATVVVLVPAAGFIIFVDVNRWGGNHSELLFAATMGVFCIAGALTGMIGKKVGFFEAYLLSIVFAVLAWVHLSKGWSVVLGVGPGADESFFEMYAARPPGFKYLGEMWERTLYLGIVAAFLLQLVGGSLSFMFWGERLAAREGRGGSAYETRVSLRHLLGQTRSGAISLTALVAVSGVALGVAALVAVTAVMSGYQRDVQDRILSTNAHLVVQKYGVDFTEYDEIEEAVLELDDVVAASPFTFNEAMLSTGDRAFNVLLKGIDSETASGVTGIASNLCTSAKSDGTCVRVESGESGAPLLARQVSETDGVPSLVIGSELFKKLQMPVGSVVVLSTPVGMAGARGNAPRRMRFRIGGVFSSGMYEFDARLIYTSLKASQEMMGLGDAVTGVELRLTDPARVELAGARVDRAIGRYPYRTLDWRKLNEGIFRALSLQKIVFFLILSFIVVVAAFNIASTLFMAVVEKSAEIGVLKSMGARDTSIMRIFVVEGWIVGGAGTLLGLALGLLVCFALNQLEIRIAANVYMVGKLSVQVKTLEVVLTATAAMVISHLATLYPALKAAKQNPVDAMRYD